MSGTRRVPGGLVVASWIALFAVSFVVAGLGDAVERRANAVRLVQAFARSDSTSGPARAEPNPLQVLALVRAQRALNTEQGIFEAAGLGWLLALGLLTFGTGRWVAARRSWASAQFWRGRRLLGLYVVLAVAGLLYAAVISMAGANASDISLVVTWGALLLLASVALARVTWHWLTGRRAQVASDGSLVQMEEGSRLSRVRPVWLWIILALVGLAGVALLTRYSGPTCVVVPRAAGGPPRAYTACYVYDRWRHHTRWVTPE